MCQICAKSAKKMNQAPLQIPDNQPMSNRPVGHNKSWV